MWFLSSLNENSFLDQLPQGPLDGKEGGAGKGGDMPQGEGGRLTDQNPQHIPPGLRGKKACQILHKISVQIFVQESTEILQGKTTKS